jgi:hypothetical protein
MKRFSLITLLFLALTPFAFAATSGPLPTAAQKPPAKAQVAPVPKSAPPVEATVITLPDGTKLTEAQVIQAFTQYRQAILQLQTELQKAWERIGTLVDMLKPTGAATP